MIRSIAPDDTTALIALAEATGLFGPHETEELALMLADHFSGETNSQDIWITDDDGGLVGRVCCAGTNDRWDAVVASPVQKPGIPVQSPESIRLRLVLRSPSSYKKAIALLPTRKAISYFEFQNGVNTLFISK